MACVLTTGFTLPCLRAMGGVQELLVAELANVDGITVASGAVTAITMGSGTQFFKYELGMGGSSAQAVVGGDRAVQSRFYTHTVQVQVGQYNTTMRNEFKVLGQTRTVWIAKHHDGTYWLYGASEDGQRGLEMSEGQAQTGTASADLNGFNFTFTGEELDPPMQVPSGLIAALLLPA